MRRRCLHDIGKLAVPEHIISKPGRLTPEEFEKMKIHPLVGAEILERVRFPYPVVPIVRAHHEKWDGSGYPFGLKGEEIPVGARILSSVDFLDAMASDRQYRRALPLEEVMKRLSAESGKSFDPKVVSVLERRYRQLEKLVESTYRREPVAPLSTEMKVEAGAAPAAGFEDITVKDAPGQEATFLSSIAAARQEAQTLFELSQDLGASLSLGETFSVFSVKLQTAGALRRHRDLRKTRARNWFRNWSAATTTGCSHRCVFRWAAAFPAGWHRTGSRSSTAIPRWSRGT